MRMWGRGQKWKVMGKGLSEDVKLVWAHKKMDQKRSTKVWKDAVSVVRVRGRPRKSFISGSIISLYHKVLISLLTYILLSPSISWPLFPFILFRIFLLKLTFVFSLNLALTFKWLPCLSLPRLSPIHLSSLLTSFPFFQFQSYSFSPSLPIHLPLSFSTLSFISFTPLLYRVSSWTPLPFVFPVPASDRIPFPPASSVILPAWRTT